MGSVSQSSAVCLKGSFVVALISVYFQSAHSQVVAFRTSVELGPYSKLRSSAIIVNAADVGILSTFHRNSHNQEFCAVSETKIFSLFGFSRHEVRSNRVEENILSPEMYHHCTAELHVNSCKE